MKDAEPLSLPPVEAPYYWRITTCDYGANRMRVMLMRHRRYWFDTILGWGLFDPSDSPTGVFSLQRAARMIHNQHLSSNLATETQNALKGDYR